MAAQTINLGNVGASSLIDIQQDWHFDQDGIFTLRSGNDVDANERYATFYSDEQVSNLIILLQYYKLIRKQSGRWEEND